MKSKQSSIYPAFKPGQIWKFVFDEISKKQNFHYYLIVEVTQLRVVCYYLNTKVILEEETSFLQIGAKESKEILVCDV